MASIGLLKTYLILRPPPKLTLIVNHVKLSQLFKC